jgi:alkaline phosphatase isozyme conversion protein
MNRSILSILLCFIMLTACSDVVDEDMNEYSEESTEAPLINETNEFDEDENTGENDLSNTNESSTYSNGEIAREYLEVIANDIGDRDPGSEGELRTAQYIQGVFEDIGYEVKRSEFEIEDEGESLTSANVIAVKEGVSDKVIVVGAHYDDAFERGTTGADDNASGVAVMLEVAKKVFNVDTPYTINFVAFGSEELDLNGSSFFVDNLDRTEIGLIFGMVNLDSLIAGDKMYVYGTDGTGTMLEWVMKDAETLGFDIEGKCSDDLNNADGSPCECADYDAFEKANIPFVYFEATNWDLSPDAMIQVDPEYGDDGEIRHTKYDTVQYIDANFPGRIDEHMNVYVTLLYDLLTEFE